MLIALLVAIGAFSPYAALVLGPSEPKAEPRPKVVVVEAQPVISVAIDETLTGGRQVQIAGLDQGYAGEAVDLLLDRSASLEERKIWVRTGDTLMGLLTREGLPRPVAHAVIAAIKPVYDPRRLKPGQQVAMAFDDPQASSRKLLRLRLEKSFDRDIVARRGDGGAFAVEEVERPLTRERVFVEGSIRSSLYQAAVAQGVPPSHVLGLIRALSYDVDFQREIQPGDSFKLLYEHWLDEDGDVVSDGRLLHADLKLGGKWLTLYRFTSKDGTSDFYNDNGESVRKALMRTPIDGARISSRYGKRRHPILGYTRFHPGTDFAAPRGTPIYAAGSGVIASAGRKGAYGKYIRIRHNATYSTAYAHLSRFARGTKKGTRVKQGQVIGYVGSTGRSTGPHLHYEVFVNGKHINPLSLKLPAGGKLKGRERERFKIVKAAIDREYARRTPVLLTAIRGE